MKTMKEARAAALELARGSFQADLIIGRETLSLTSLRGRAKKFSGRYARSRDNLLERLERAGIPFDTVRPPRSRIVLLFGRDRLEAYRRLEPLLAAVRLAIRLTSDRRLRRLLVLARNQISLAMQRLPVEENERRALQRAERIAQRVERHAPAQFIDLAEWARAVDGEWLEYHLWPLAKIVEGYLQAAVKLWSSGRSPMPALQRAAELKAQWEPKLDKRPAKSAALGEVRRLHSEVIFAELAQELAAWRSKLEV